MSMDLARSLADRVRGRVIVPGDPAYDGARATFNGMVDQRPRLIVRPVDTDDVASAVRGRRELDLPLAVRGGGHSVAGHSMPEDAVVIDLSLLRGVTVDPTSADRRGPRWQPAHGPRRGDGRPRPSPSLGDVLRHRRRRSDAERRDQLPRRIRGVRLRRTHRRRAGHRRRLDRPGRRGPRARPALGAAWRRRQLRGRDPAALPTDQGRASVWGRAPLPGRWRARGARAALRARPVRSRRALAPGGRLAFRGDRGRRPDHHRRLARRRRDRGRGDPAAARPSGALRGRTSAPCRGSSCRPTTRRSPSACATTGRATSCARRRRPWPRRSSRPEPSRRRGRASSSSSSTARRTGSPPTPPRSGVGRPVPT